MKKFIVLMCMLLPVGVFSQEVKIAIVNANEVFSLMPENDEVEKKLAALSAEYQADLESMTNEHKMKYEEYIKLQDSLNDNLKLRRQQELTELEGRIQNLYTIAQQDMEQKQTELYAPMQEKLQNAIKAVGDEQGYTMIFNRLDQILLYIGTSAIDATPLVKAKLGLR